MIQSGLAAPRVASGGRAPPQAVVLTPIILIGLKKKKAVAMTRII